MTEGICADRKAGEQAAMDQNNIPYTLGRRGEGSTSFKKIGISSVDLLE